MLKLRRIDEDQARLDAAAEAWRARGWQASIEHLPRMGSWMRVQDTARTWQGWVEPGMWLEGVAHELASLACCADSEQLAARLFAVTATPLNLPMPELRYDILDVGAPVDGTALPDARLLRVRAAECPVWLARVPDIHAALPLDLSDVRFPLDVEVGRSRARLSTLRQVRRGDVLIVRDAQRRLSCAGRIIGGYQQEEGSAMLETYLHDDIDDMAPGDGPTYDDAAYGGHDQQVQPALALPFEQLPVELVFVLQRQRMTLAELQQLGRTRTFALPAGAEQRVEVRVNDTLLARGELVQLDGRLGVEISEWLMASNDLRRLDDTSAADGARAAMDPRHVE
ncbi:MULTISPECIES: YscQ/HrcQ family type III secretion apparatus protein [Pandoraea]|uniref:YscQ/HrcQ family type III secretion apparatus protein n=1 Tax=Pandoraea TaxID=93217 RepID=UPI001F5D085E|nr:MULTISPECIES: YscQ/HrcQ family type III secretion apparatus protein [Pandoraea]MCI3207296.1 YscQ/HrcQ family type III secretion apparatus protein [Pandoraea sp. LA3]MDN4585325.1 YscQ/HrcQ family type III secretion apparatus protein [Pandoraea capi]